MKPPLAGTEAVSGAQLASPEFHSSFADCRAVEIPSTLDAEGRKRFVARIRDAVAVQTDLARKCDTILRPTGEIREDGNHVLISHERAAPANPSAIAGSKQHPAIDTVWWLTWSTLRALKAASAANQTHGGIQLGSLLRDETGRMKLADFGIAVAFETVCGLDARRYVACEVDGQRKQGGRLLSGVWRLLAEDEARDFGWIAPYFGHELLDGRAKLNAKSDQFALGALLFLWTTGSHPYGVELSDPTLMMYFQFEPYQLDEQRPDWAKAFERKSTGVATSADQPILAWSDLIHKLLASDPKERYGSFEEVEAIVSKYADDRAWSAASKKISDSLASLEAGEVDAFLSAVAPLATGEGLPQIWRSHLAAYVKTAESQKEAIGRRKQLAKKLDQGQNALDNQKVEEARAAADAILESPDADDALRKGARELLEACEQQQALLLAGAAELTRHNLSMAREALLTGDPAEARKFATLVVQDKFATPESIADARQLLAEVAQAEEQAKRHLTELTQATVERREGRLDQAEQRLKALTADVTLSESIATQARLLLKDIGDARQRLAAQEQALAEGEQALDEANLTVARQRLDGLSAGDLADALKDRRKKLAARLEKIEQAAQARKAAESALGAGDVAAARSAIEQGLAVTGLPDALLLQFEELAAQCDRAVADARQAAIERATTALQQAEKCYAEMDLARCRELVSTIVLKCDALEPSARTRAESLNAACARAEAAQKTIERAEKLLSQRDYDGTEALLGAPGLDDLPPKLAEKIAALRADLERQRKASDDEERAAVKARLVDAKRLAERGDLDPAEEQISAIPNSRVVVGDLKAERDAIKAMIDRYRPASRSLADAEKALADGKVKKVRTILDGLSHDVKWVSERAVQIEGRLAAAEARLLQEAADRVESVLSDAESLLRKLEVDAAMKVIEDARGVLDSNPAATKRKEALVADARRLARWMPRVQPLLEAMERREYAQVYSGATKLEKEPELPDLVAARLKELTETSKKFIAARQEEIKAELAALAAEIEQKKRKARDVPARVAAVESDPLAAKTQKAEAAEIKKRFDALPVPKTPVGPIAIAAVIILAVAGGGYFMLRPKPPRPGPSTFIAAWNSTAQAAAARAGEFRNFTLQMGTDEWPVALSAKLEDGRELPLGTVDDDELPSNLIEKLLEFVRIAPPVAPVDVAALEREALAAARAQFPDGFKPFKLLHEPPGAPAGMLKADVGGRVVDIAATADGKAPPEWTASLLKLVAPEKALAVDVAALEKQARDAATAKYGNEFKSFTLRHEPPNSGKGKLIADVDGIATEIGATDNGQPPAGWLETLIAKIAPPAAPIVDLAALQQQADAEARRRYGDDFKPATLAHDPPNAAKGTLSATVDGKKITLGNTDKGKPAADWLDKLLPSMKPAPAPAVNVAAIEQEATAAAKAAYPDGYKPFRLRHEPPDASSGRLIAEVDGAVIELASTEKGQPTAKWKESLLAAIAPPPLPVFDAARLAEMEEEVKRGQAEFREFKLAHEPPGKSDGVLRVSIEGGAPQDLVRTAKGEPVGDWKSPLLARIAVVLPVFDVARLASMEADAKKAQPDHRPFTLSHDPPGKSDGTLKASVEGEEVVLGTTSRGVPPANWLATLAAAIKPAPLPPVDVAALQIEATSAATARFPDGFKPFKLKHDPENAAAGRLLAEVDGRDIELAKTEKSAPVGDWKTPLIQAVAPSPPAFVNIAALTEEATNAAQKAFGKNYRKFRLDHPENAASGILKAIIGDNEKVVELGPTSKGRPADQWLALLLRELELPAVITPARILAGLSNAATVAPADFVEALRQAAAAKCLQLSPRGGYTLSTSLTQGAPDQVLLNVSRQLQKTLVPDLSIKPGIPLVFVEFYEEGGRVFGLGWTATADAGDNITGVSGLTVWESILPTVNAIGDLERFYSQYSSDSSVAERLLPSKLIPSQLSASPGGAWGVVVAPAGALWAVRWDSVMLAGRSINGLQRQDGTGVDSGFSKLGDLLDRTARVGPRIVAPRVGVWCVPSLGGYFKAPDGATQALGAGGDIGIIGLTFAKRQASGFTFLELRSKDTSRLPPTWSNDARKIVSSTIGREFWGASNFDTRGVWSFAIVQTGP